MALFHILAKNSLHYLSNILKCRTLAEANERKRDFILTETVAK